MPSDKPMPKPDFEMIDLALRAAGDNPQTEKLWQQANHVYVTLRNKSQSRFSLKKSLPHSDLYAFLQAIQGERPNADLQTCVKDACKKANIHEEDTDLAGLLVLIDALLAIPRKISQQGTTETPPTELFDKSQESERPSGGQPSDTATELFLAHAHAPEQAGNVLLHVSGAPTPEAGSAIELATSPLPGESEQDPKLFRGPISSGDPLLQQLVEESEALHRQVNESIGKQKLLEDKLQVLSHQLAGIQRQSKTLLDSAARLPQEYVSLQHYMGMRRQRDSLKDQRERAAHEIINLIDVFVKMWKYDPFALAESAAIATSDGAKEQEYDNLQVWKTAVLDHLYASLIDMLRQTCGVAPIEIRMGQAYQQGRNDMVAKGTDATDDPQKDRQISRILQLGYKHSDGRIFRPVEVNFYRFTAAS